MKTPTNKREDGVHVVRLELLLRQDGQESPLLSRLSEFEPDIDARVPKTQLVELACRLYKSRRMRSRFFADGLFGEPAWDMLLTLFCAQYEGEQLSVSSLCYSADVPTTTALRWCRVLEDKKMIHRRKDDNDARRTYLVLSPKGHKAISDYLASIHHGLAPKRS
ncbi:hypothetical protein [Sphingomicrobium flavum]|uniref:hypothetical protein n=1 Tax=Sphingomicrobium flavum TaxID=1229164 RepID=UPI0021AE2F55|nr:hypothetical protein [Sphingomicrobium flavum]